jgi:hypothetical protein
MSKILKTSAEGRKCKFLGCTRNLSIYNHADYCHLHREEMAEKQKPLFIKSSENDEVQINEAGDGFVTK